MQRIELPRHLDDPQRLFLWQADEVIPFTAVLGVGMFTRTLGISLVVAIALLMLLRRYRDARPDGYLLHMLYWYGIWPVKGHTFINPFQRRVLPYPER